jgi:putative membrane protein
MFRNWYILGLLAIFTVLWAILAIAPLHRDDWLLENVLLAAAVVALIVSYRPLPLSLISYSTLFVFFCLHTIGAHYTYAEVPYDAAFRTLTGVSFNELMGWERNHYDRLVHFCYGLLLAYPVRELCLRVTTVRGFLSYFLPLDLTMSTSMLYELIEWWAAVTFGGDLGVAFLGTQGDVWDAHKDMALASLGALITMMVTAGVSGVFKRDFAREWIHSVKSRNS